MKLCILFHDNCFDGLVSAGLFHAFAVSRIDPKATAQFGGLVHALKGQEAHEPMDTGPLGGARLIGDINVIVDFRYISDPSLNWWFDHHSTAFSTEELRARFESDKTGQKYFDPKAPSCAGFIARMLARDHDFDPSPHVELLNWADIIDSANFRDPKMAVELKEPALRLMTWIENSRIFEERAELIRELFSSPLDVVASLPFIENALKPLLDAHFELIEEMRDRYLMREGVFFCDLTDFDLDAVNKFIPYYLQPQAKYAVVVTTSSHRTKVSVGYNPWAPASERLHDIGSICESYGGGGHAVVGAVSLAPQASAQALEIAEKIVLTLKG